jgi:hypothetical protein
MKERKKERERERERERMCSLAVCNLPTKEKAKIDLTFHAFYCEKKHSHAATKESM